MPVKVLKIGGKFRVVDEKTNRISRAVRQDKKLGRPSDGGGHTDREKAVRQAAHINSSVNRKK